MKKSRSIAILVAVLLATTVIGCARGNDATPPEGEREIVVGFSQMENNNPWRIAETRSIKEEAQKRGFRLVFADAQGDTAKQVSDVEDMVAQGVDYIVLAPREYEGLVPALDAAKAAGIPVILIDRRARGTVGEDYLTFLGSNFIEQGQRAAEWLVNATNGNAVIVELTGTPGSSVAIDRKKGFEDYIKNYPNMQIVASQTGDFARAQGQEVMEHMLQAHGDRITAVYAHNDEMAIGAINAIEAAGKVPGRDIIIVSIDGTRDALQAIIDGKMGATVESSPFFGPITFDVIEKHINGEPIPPEIIIPDRFFDQQNAAQYIDEAY